MEDIWQLPPLTIPLCKSTANLLALQELLGQAGPEWRWSHELDRLWWDGPWGLCRPLGPHSRLPGVKEESQSNFIIYFWIKSFY